jgi:hypothetical protein
LHVVIADAAVVVATAVQTLLEQRSFFLFVLNNKVLKVWWSWLDKMKVTNIASTLFNCFVFAVFRRIGAMRDEFIDAPNYNGYETGAGSILF